MASKWYRKKERPKKNPGQMELDFSSPPNPAPPEESVTPELYPDTVFEKELT